MRRDLVVCELTVTQNAILHSDDPSAQRLETSFLFHVNGRYGDGRFSGGCNYITDSDARLLLEYV